MRDHVAQSPRGLSVACQIAPSSSASSWPFYFLPSLDLGFPANPPLPIFERVIMAIVTRWVGSSISTPKERGLVPIGRQRRYGAVELAGAGEQVNVNDVVEVNGGDEIIKTEVDHPGAPRQHLRLAQVCVQRNNFIVTSKYFSTSTPKTSSYEVFEARDEYCTFDSEAHRLSFGCVLPSLLPCI